MKEQVKWQDGYQRVTGKSMRKEIMGKEAVAVIRERRRRHLCNMTLEEFASHRLSTGPIQRTISFMFRGTRRP